MTAPEYPQGTVNVNGHVIGKVTTLTVAYLDRLPSAALFNAYAQLRAAYADLPHEDRALPGGTFLSAAAQESIREAARNRGMNPDRVHFYSDCIIFDDQDVPDSEYDAAARHEYLAGPPAPAVAHVDHGKTALTAAITFADEVRPYPPALALFEDGPRRGKSGKNKATRLHPLPPRRL